MGGLADRWKFEERPLKVGPEVLKNPVANHAHDHVN